jgi:hypothetical protein
VWSRDSNRHYWMQIVRKDACVPQIKLIQPFEHPFIIPLHFVLQNRDRSLLYFGYEHVAADLASILHKTKKIDIITTKIWAAEIFLALTFLNERGIVVRYNKHIA